MIKVIIAEDHNMVRAGLRALLEKNNGFEVIGEASNGQDAVTLTQKLKPDVLVMDIRMPVMNGIQSAEKIKSLNLQTKVVLLSMYSDEGLVNQALRSEVKGYILKSAASDELVFAIRAAYQGDTYLSSQISSLLVDLALNPRFGGNLVEPYENLSPREKEILQLIAEEYTSSEIAKQLSISEKTVEKHRSHLMEKLNVRNLAGLVRVAVKYGLVDQNDL